MVTRLLSVSSAAICGVDVLPNVSPCVEVKFVLKTSAFVEVDWIVRANSEIDSSNVVEAFANVWSPVQMFAFATLSESELPDRSRLPFIVVVATAPEPLPVKSVFAARFAHPVPPLATPSMPETSPVRLTSEVVTNPLTALRNPPSEPMLSAVVCTPAPKVEVACACRVVVALPFATDKSVLEALPRDARPVTESVVLNVTAPLLTSVPARAVVAKKFVVVALVVVEFTVLRLSMDDEAVTNRLVVVALLSVVLPVTFNVPATATFPPESMVVVAVPPKYAFVKTDSRVVDAFPKLCKPVHTFALPMFKASVPPDSCRLLAIVVVATAPAPLPVKSVLAARFAHPVPPLATPSMPEMSAVRLTSEFVTTPAVALRNPESVPITTEPKNPCVEEA